MKKHIHALLSAAIALTLVSCGGSKSKDNDNNSGGGPGVYVAGFEAGSDSKKHAILWKDGVAHQLSNSFSYSASVYVVGNDVYVAGTECLDDDGNVTRATIWKNGVAQRLSINESEAYSVFVSGSDVYVAGWEAYVGGYRAMLWKNNAPQNLQREGNYSSANSVFVSGSDVYVGGFDMDDAIIWKNEVPMTCNPDGSARVYSVYFSNNALYGAGYWDESDPYYRAVTVKVVGSDVTPQYLDVPPSMATSVFVSGNNVYAAGYAYIGGWWERRAKVWRNGTPQTLSNNDSSANSVFVSGSNVYVAGTEYVGNNDQRARLWKNDIAQSLSNKTSGAHSIFVAK